MMDKIEILLSADEEVAAAVEAHKDYIMKETLALEIAEGSDLKEYDLNGHKTGIDVEKK